MFRRENYFKIWLQCCGILLVLLLHCYRQGRLGQRLKEQLLEFEFTAKFRNWISSVIFFPFCSVIDIMRAGACLVVVATYFKFDGFC
ncbi:hypothetical protein CMV_004989 [Castanea mollissima]|uniref:Uncharacterized protein n=1 Tax=Castanea mollissima TaxID=60419 RepID=A0A8J4VUY8_9ROSI|nr:hypothetical protein CMV_004989 [Castanea mollissima]